MFTPPNTPNRAARMLAGSFGVLGLVVALAVSAGCTRFSLEDALSGVIHPSIVPASGVTGTQVVEREFDFEGTRVRLSVPVDRAVYEGAVSAKKEAVFLSGEEPPDWVSGYYRAFIGEEHQDAFYDAVLDALHAVRDDQGLDAARYVELVTAMAQSMEYRIDPGDLAPKFPIETFTDGFGDCDDKTLLVAGLLARDGYDVSVLFFGPEEHVAMGIRAPGLDYRSTGYGFVEMTEPALVGVPTEKLTSGAELTSDPTVIGIGEGSAAYTAGDQIAFIRRRLGEVRALRERLSDEIDSTNRRLAEERAELEQESSRLQTGMATEADVRQYNERVAQYNARVAQANELASRHNELVEVERFVAANQTARRLVYERLAGVSL